VDFAFGLQLTFAQSHNLIHRLSNSGVIIFFATLSADVGRNILDQDIAAFPMAHNVDLFGSYLATAKVTIKTLFTHWFDPSALACVGRAI